jgi:hypothetical protein
MSQTPDTKAIHTIFDSLAKAQGIENIALYDTFKERLSEGAMNNPENFYFAVIYPHEKFVRGLVQQVFQTSDGDLLFLYVHGQYLDQHLEKLFERLEGRASCADKARTCLGALASAFRSGEPKEFDYTGEYTFHLPKTILRTHSERVDFFNALKNLYYGRPDEYLQQLQAFMQPAA